MRKWRSEITLKKVLKKINQPPVVAAIAGSAAAITVGVLEVYQEPVDTFARWASWVAGSDAAAGVFTVLAMEAAAYFLVNAPTALYQTYGPKDSRTEHKNWREVKNMGTVSDAIAVRSIHRKKGCAGVKEFIEENASSTKLALTGAFIAALGFGIASGCPIARAAFSHAWQSIAEKLAEHGLPIRLVPAALAGVGAYQIGGSFTSAVHTIVRPCKTVMTRPYRYASSSSVYHPLPTPEDNKFEGGNNTDYESEKEKEKARERERDSILDGMSI